MFFVAKTLGVHVPVIRALRNIWEDVRRGAAAVQSRRLDGRPTADLDEAVRLAMGQLGGDAASRRAAAAAAVSGSAGGGSAGGGSAGDGDSGADAPIAAVTLVEQRWIRQDIASVLRRHERLRRRGRALNLVLTIDAQWRRGRARFSELDDYDSGVLEGAELRAFAAEMLAAVNLPGGALTTDEVAVEVEALMGQHEAIGMAAFGRFFVSRARALGRVREAARLRALGAGVVGDGGASSGADDAHALPADVEISTILAFPAFAAVVLEAYGWSEQRRWIREACERVREVEATEASAAAERDEDASFVSDVIADVAPQRGWLEGGIAWLAGWDTEGGAAATPADLSTQVWQELASSVGADDGADLFAPRALDSTRVIREFTLKVSASMLKPLQFMRILLTI